MHIGFLQAYFSRSSVGGGELHTEHLARALENNGHEVTIFTDRPPTRRDGISDLDVKEYPTPLKVNPITELTLAQRAFDDLCECDVVTLTDDSAWRGVDLPVPTVMIFHIVWHGWIERHRPSWRILSQKPQAYLYRWMENRICRKVNSIVAISPNVHEDILLVDETIDDKIVSIPNGVDIDRFSPAENKYNKFTVYFQGRLVDMKNPDVLLEAMCQSDQDWRLLIGGDGPLRSSLETFVMDHDLGDRVSFLGYVPDEKLPEYYAKSHVFALPSDYEGMPLTVLEAAASGTAIVASPRAGTDFVTDEMGHVIDPHPDVMAQVIDTLSKEPDRVITMGNAARERALAYSWEAIADRYEELYSNLVTSGM